MSINTSIYQVIKALKSDKKDIFRFYKTQGYSASFIGHDQCYVVKENNLIIAAAIISAGKTKSNFYLLHALVTDKSYRGNNIASSIINTICNETNELLQIRYDNTICFADTSLRRFYQKNNFSICDEQSIKQLPAEFQNRLSRYRIKQKNLQCFINC